MKNKLLFMILVLFLGIMYVNAYSVSDFANKVNSGDVTKAFIDREEKGGCKVTINATAGGNNANVSYHFVCNEEKEEVVNGKKERVTKETYNLEGNIVYTMGSDNILVSSLDRTPKEIENDPFYERVLALSPYWGVEMSSKYSEISKYLNKNHKKELLETYALIFDKCYMQEMGVCYSKTPGTVSSNYMAKITMDDSGANYALKYLKKEQRQLNTKNLSIKLGIVAVCLAGLILVLKSMTPDPKRKRCKY